MGQYRCRRDESSALIRFPAHWQASCLWHFRRHTNNALRHQPPLDSNRTNSGGLAPQHSVTGSPVGQQNDIVVGVHNTVYVEVRRASTGIGTTRAGAPGTQEDYEVGDANIPVTIQIP